MNNRKIGLVGRYVRKASRIIRQQGPAALAQMVINRVARKRQYRKYFIMTRATAAQLAAQRQAVFAHAPMISLLVPLYNTPEIFLRELIESVQAQTYGNWQLCLADGSTQACKTVEQTVMAYARDDRRLSYVRLAENRGISGNTNACLELASGEYIGLLDHDDLLAPNALFEVVSAIRETGADFVYTDEMSFEKSLERVTNIHFKPDFAIDNLRSNNYICHFSCFSRALIDLAGPFDNRFNGSQDYDMILRLTEQAKKVHHIPQVLYYWRVHSASVASDISAKPYAITAAKLAIQSHLDRTGIAGTVSDSAMLSTYRISYLLTGQPRISVIVPAHGPAATLRRGLEMVLKRSTYGNFEVIVVGTSSLSSPENLPHDPRLKMLPRPAGIPLPEALNAAISSCSGEYVVLLDAGLAPLTPAWLEELLMFAQRADVGAVGAKLLSRGLSVLHAGIGIGLKSLFGYYFRGYDRNAPGYSARLSYAQDVSAVSGSCLMTARNRLQALGGFDPVYGDSLFDVDYCLRLREAGFLVVYTPYAELASLARRVRLISEPRPETAETAAGAGRFRQRWQAAVDRGDPYYNRNLSMTGEDFTVNLQ